MAGPNSFEDVTKASSKSKYFQTGQWRHAMHQRFAKDVVAGPSSTRRVGRASDDRVTFAYDLWKTSLSSEEFLPASFGHHPSSNRTGFPRKFMRSNEKSIFAKLLNNKVVFIESGSLVF